MTHAHWVIEYIAMQAQLGTIKKLAQAGYRVHGRGALTLDMAKPNAILEYRNIAWFEPGADYPQIQTAIQQMRDYNPQRFAIVVAVVPLGGDRFETQVLGVKLD